MLMAPQPTDRDEALYAAIQQSPETFNTVSDLAEAANIVPGYAQQLLLRMERQGTVRRDRFHRTDYWSIDGNSTAASAPQESPRLTPRHSTPGERSAPHPLHHRKR